MSRMTSHSFGADAGLVILMIVTEIVSLLMIGPVQNAGLLAFENPDTLLNVVLFIFLMLVFTAVLLLLIKKNAKKILSAIIAIALAWVIYYLVMALCALTLSGILPHVIGIAAGVFAVLLLLIHPEWYLINLVGLAASAGCAVIFGVSLSIVPVIVLLVLLMVYDYISVKRSKHMLTLADGVMHQKMPIMFVMPKNSHIPTGKQESLLVMIQKTWEHTCSAWEILFFRLFWCLSTKESRRRVFRLLMTVPLSVFSLNIALQGPGAGCLLLSFNS